MPLICPVYWFSNWRACTHRLFRSFEELPEHSWLKGKHCPDPLLLCGLFYKSGLCEIPLLLRHGAGVDLIFLFSCHTHPTYTSQNEGKAPLHSEPQALLVRRISLPGHQIKGHLAVLCARVKVSAQEQWQRVDPEEVHHSDYIVSSPHRSWCPRSKRIMWRRKKLQDVVSVFMGARLTETEISEEKLKVDPEDTRQSFPTASCFQGAEQMTQAQVTFSLFYSFLCSLTEL